MRKMMRVVTYIGIGMMAAAILSMNLWDTDRWWLIVLIMLVMGEITAMVGFMWEVCYVLFKEVSEYRKLNDADFIVSLFNDSSSN